MEVLGSEPKEFVYVSGVNANLTDMEPQKKETTLTFCETKIQFYFMFVIIRTKFTNL